LLKRPLRLHPALEQRGRAGYGKEYGAQEIPQQDALNSGVTHLRVADVVQDNDRQRIGRVKVEVRTCLCMDMSGRSPQPWWALAPT
jgi:hypothetical protein